MLDGFAPFERVGEIPAVEDIEHQFGVFSDSLAEDFDNFDIAPEALGAGAGPVGEEPFLPAVPGGEQGLSAITDLVELERIAKRGGIQIDRIAGGATQKAVDGGAEVTAAEVPEGIVDGTDGEQEVAGASVAVQAPELIPDNVAGEAVLADQESTELLINHKGRLFIDWPIEPFDTAARPQAKVGGADLLGAALGWRCVPVGLGAVGFVNVKRLSLILLVGVLVRLDGALIFHQFDGLDADFGLLSRGRKRGGECRQKLTAVHGDGFYQGGGKRVCETGSLVKLTQEFPSLLRLALPVIVAELGWMLMGIVDTIMVGRLGAEAIGAVAIGNVVFHTIGLLIIGIVLGLDTLISQAFGAGEFEDARHSLRQGLWLAVLVCPVLLVMMLAVPATFPLWGLDAKVSELAKPFSWILALSVLPIGAYTVFRRYLQAVHLVQPVSWALLSANAVNWGLNWLLIEGHWGAPKLGVNGSAWSTVGARVYLAAFLYVVLQRMAKREGVVLLRWEGPDWKRVGELFRLGLPAAGHIFLEVAVFGAATVLAGQFPPAALAAHEITLNYACFMYMVPLGISQATSVRVGNHVGARDFAAARVSGNTGILTGALFMACSGLAMYFAPRMILNLYTQDEALVGAAIPLLFWAAAFQLFDGTQTVATGALRGLGDTHTAFVANMVGYWVLGLPVGAWLCFARGLGVPGLWMGLSLGLTVVAAGLAGRWLRASRNGGLA